MTTPIGRLVAAACAVRATRLLLRTVGFSRSVAILERWAGRVLSPREPHVVAAEISAVSGAPFPATCLDRSLLLWAVLGSGGYDAHLRIGVAPAPGGIDGHAWVEVAGSVINDDPDVGDRFATFDGDPTTLVLR